MIFQWRLRLCQGPEEMTWTKISPPIECDTAIRQSQSSNSCHCVKIASKSLRLSGKKIVGKLDLRRNPGMISQIRMANPCRVLLRPSVSIDFRSSKWVNRPGGTISSFSFIQHLHASTCHIVVGFGPKIIPIGSMYGIFNYIYHENQPNVGNYTIHGSYGIEIPLPLPFDSGCPAFYHTTAVVDSDP